MPAAASTGTRRLPSPKVQPSGRWGLWLHAQRTAAKRTQKQVFDDLRSRWPDLFPWRSETSLDSYRAFEKGLATPDAAQEAAFLAYYPAAGPPAPMSAAEGGDTTLPSAALIRALEDQTAAISELARQVKALLDRDPLPGEIAAAVALAVGETLRAGGLVDGTRRS